MLTQPQRAIFERVKAFVLARRSPSPAREPKARRRLVMKNEFSARERAFIGKLADDLHLGVRWDEFAVVDGDGDGEEVNVVTWRFPGDDDEGDSENLEGQVAPANGDAVVDVPAAGEDGGDDEWVDEEDEEDEESRAAVDRVLRKYEKAKVYEDDGDFDERHERKIEEKMAEWKAGYYQVFVFLPTGAVWLIRVLGRASWRYRITTSRRWGILCTDMSRGCSGSCIIIIQELPVGGGFIITIMHPGFPVGFSFSLCCLADLSMAL